MSEPRSCVVTSAGAPAGRRRARCSPRSRRRACASARSTSAAPAGGGGGVDRPGAPRAARRERRAQAAARARGQPARRGGGVRSARRARAHRRARRRPTPTPVVGRGRRPRSGAAWAQTDADRFLAVDDLAAVALADAGVEGERILVVGAIGERAFADAGARGSAPRCAARSGSAASWRWSRSPGSAPSSPASSSLQLSLLDAAERDHVPVRRRRRRWRSRPWSAARSRSLGLRGKLFGATARRARCCGGRPT